MWSDDAKPDGYADVIDVRWAANALAAQIDLDRGRIDVARQTAGFARRHRNGIHETPRAGTVFWHLDTRMAPFDDVRARRAVSYAVDRAQAARAAGALSEILFVHGPMGAARPTCQVLPPSLPEYRPYCPFTLHPSGAGTWSAPDLAKARRLSARAEPPAQR